MPLQIQLPSLRVAIHEERQMKEIFTELKTLDEKKIAAQQNLDIYRQRISNAFNKCIRVWSFQEPDLVLATRVPMIIGKN